jgi:mannose-1-phosphate guanylyltransferase
MKVLIIAGGKGSRLWPISKPGHPKQLQKLLSDKSLLQETVDRVLPIIEPGDIYLVVSNEFQVQEVKKQLPDIPEQNILQEPTGRNTAAAVAFGTLRIQKIHGNDYILTVWADHYVGNPELLHKGVNTAISHLNNNPESLILIGVKPTYPETGYGYIRHENSNSHIKKVLEFKEKPNKETAETYINHGHYLWNAGMFLWKVEALLNAIEKHASPYLNVNIENYASLPDLSIDEAVLQKADNLLTIPLDLDWKDIGHWAALRDHHGADKNGNYIVNRSGRTIATVGVKDLIIVDTESELLICHADSAQDVKKITEELKN